MDLSDGSVPQDFLKSPYMFRVRALTASHSAITDPSVFRRLVQFDRVRLLPSHHG